MLPPRKTTVSAAGLVLAVALCACVAVGVRGTVAKAADAASGSSTAKPTITWEGTVTIRDRYTHDYSGDDPDSFCTGTAVTTLTTRYTVPRQSAAVGGAGSVILPARYTLDQQTASVSGNGSCRVASCEGWTLEEHIDGPGRFSTVDAGFGGDMIFDRGDKKLEFQGSAKGSRDVAFPEPRWVAKGYQCPGDKAGTSPAVHVGGGGGPRLEEKPVGASRKDYRLPVEVKIDPTDPGKKLLRVAGHFVFQANGGQPGVAGNGLPLGNWSNFSPLVRTTGKTEISITESVDADLRGTLEDEGGDIGLVCGRTTFDWFTVALKPTSVHSGEHACVFLLSNRAAKELLHLAVQGGTTLVQEFGGELGAAITKKGSYSLTKGWARTKYLRVAFPVASRAIWATNSLVTIGKAVGIVGIVTGYTFALNQIANRDACFQITADVDGTKLNASGSLVYSTTQTRVPALSLAHVYRREERTLRPDRAVASPVGLQCRDGFVAGSSAVRVFAGGTHSLIVSGTP